MIQVTPLPAPRIPTPQTPQDWDAIFNRLGR